MGGRGCTSWRGYSLSRNLIRLWVHKYEAGEFTDEAAEVFRVTEYEPKIAELERKVGQLTMEVDLLKRGPLGTRRERRELLRRERPRTLSITQGCGLTYFLVQITGRWRGTSRDKQYLRYKGERKREEMRDNIVVSLPGPLAIQVGIYISYLRGGFWGAWAGGWACILPNFIIVCALAALYVRFSGLSILTAAFTG